MDIGDILGDPNRRRFAASPEADALTEEDAMQEAQLLEVRFDVLRSTARLLFDCRGALQIEMGNTAVVVVGGLQSVSWSGHGGDFRTYWAVVGWSPRAVGELWNLSAVFTPDAHLQMKGESAEFYVGNVPGCDEPPPNYVNATEAEMVAGLAGWRSEFEPIHASFLDKRCNLS